MHKTGYYLYMNFNKEKNMKPNIKAISKRFYMKCYPDILISKEEDLDKHHGHMQEIFGLDGKHIDFFDSCVPVDFKDEGEYSRFKAEILESENQNSLQRAEFV